MAMKDNVGPYGTYTSTSLARAIGRLWLNTANKGRRCEGTDGTSSTLKRFPAQGQHP